MSSLFLGKYRNETTKKPGGRGYFVKIVEVMIPEIVVGFNGKW